MIQRIQAWCIGVCVVLAGGSALAVSAEDLLKDLNDGTPEKQLAAAMGLGDYARFPEVSAALKAKLADAKADAVVRANCVAALTRSGDPSAIPPVVAAAKNPGEKAIVRTACVAAMAIMRGEAAIPDLIEMLKTEKSNIVRSQTEDSLEKMPNPQTVVLAVTPLLKVPAAEASAIRVLGATGGPAVIAPLARQLNEGKPSTRRALIEALGSIRRPESAQVLVDWYPKGNDAEKVQILGVLSAHPYAGAIALMVSQFEDEKVYPAVRRRAALSLGAIRAQEGVRPLVRAMLNTAEDDSLRITCVQALGEFTDRDDAVVAGLIGALADKKLAEDAAIALHRITRRYFGTDKDKWAAWFDGWQKTRDIGGPGIGH